MRLVGFFIDGYEERIQIRTESATWFLQISFVILMTQMQHGLIENQRTLKKV